MYGRDVWGACRILAPIFAKPVRVDIRYAGCGLDSAGMGENP